MSNSIIWLIIIILLIIVEATTVNLTTIWFVASGILALFMSFIVDNFYLELVLFTVLGIILLITTRPILKKTLKKDDNISTNFDRIIGMKGIVTEKISKNLQGEVKVDGKRWTAYSEEEIEVDSIVLILEINGVKLKVKKVSE